MKILLTSKTKPTNTKHNKYKKPKKQYQISHDLKNTGYILLEMNSLKQIKTRTSFQYYYKTPRSKMKI